MTKKQIILLSLLVVVVLIGAIICRAYDWNKNKNGQVACTMEAKLCPDGSSVGRVGPDCEFAACPIETPDKTVKQDLNSIFKINEKVAVANIYYSSKLGVGFTYVPNQAGSNFTVGVAEIENKIYVYRTDGKPEQGQSLEVFTKDPKLSLEEAIKKEFLQGYNPADCFVKYNETNEQDLANYISAEISFPPGDNPNEPWFQNADKCPKSYSKTNGIQYFLMNKDFPDKFIFVRIGQYSITSDGTPSTANGGFNWSHSIRILDPATIADPTADWLTYNNAEFGFEFKYPKDFGANIWRAFKWPPLATVVPVGGDLVKQGCPDIQSASPENSQVNLNGVNFILYKESQGAAGSTYTTYCYTTQKEKNYYAIEFVIRYTSGCGENCGPYCGTQYESECTSFNKANQVEKPIEEMVSTLKFK